VICRTDRIVISANRATSRFSLHRKRGNCEAEQRFRYCGRDDVAARVADAVTPVFVSRRIGPQFGRGCLDCCRDDRRLYRPEPVGEGVDGALPL
jgi:hypothetical protein